MKKFTLIELLVVVAIIGILASILMPSLAKAREKAKIAVEINNRKQVITATTIYADDNSGYLPSRDSTPYLHCLRWGSGGLNINEVLMEQYIGTGDKLREELFFCDSTLNNIRNPDYGEYTNDHTTQNANYGTINYFNKPGAGSGLDSDFDISNISFGRPEDAVWSCMTLDKGAGKYMGHNAPDTAKKFDGASTAYMDGGAKWVSNKACRKFWVGNGLTFYHPDR